MRHSNQYHEMREYRFPANTAKPFHIPLSYFGTCVHYRERTDRFLQDAYKGEEVYLGSYLKEESTLFLND